MVDAEDVGLEHAGKRIRRDVGGGAIRTGNAGVVDPHVKGTEGLHGRGRQRLHLGQVAHVARPAAGSRARGSQRVHRRLDGRGRPGGDYDGGSLPRVGPGDRQAEASRAPGDDGDFAFQNTHCATVPPDLIAISDFQRQVYHRLPGSTTVVGHRSWQPLPRVVHYWGNDKWQMKNDR